MLDSQIPTRCYFRFCHPISSKLVVTISSVLTLCFDNYLFYYRNLMLATCYNITKDSIEAFLATYSKIQVLDLSNCYWFDPTFLSNIILNVSSSVKSLFLHGTKLSSHHVAEILKRSQSLSELSFTLNSTDGSFWVEKMEEEEDLENKINLKSCIFFELQDKLSKLTSVALHGDCLIMLTSFLW